MKHKIGLIIPTFINNKIEERKPNKSLKTKLTKKEREKARQERLNDINNFIKKKRGINFYFEDKDNKYFNRRFPTAKEVNDYLQNPTAKEVNAHLQNKNSMNDYSNLFKKEKINPIIYFFCICFYMIKNFFNYMEFFIYLFCLIFNILFLSFKKYFFIAIQIIFLTKHMSPVHNVFYGLQSNFGAIIFSLIFTFIILYIYMWIAFVGFFNLFEFDVIDKEGNSYSETFCSSSIQCLLIFWSTGYINSGTNDMFNTISFARNPWFSIGIFIYHLSAFLFINTILSNVFTGLITNGFDDYYEKSEEKHNDIENRCYICNLSKNKADLKGINFNRHIRDHSLTKYAEFLMYLFTKDPFDFTTQEKYIYDKIWSNDISWVPNESDDEDDDDKKK